MHPASGWYIPSLMHWSAPSFPPKPPTASRLALQTLPATRAVVVHGPETPGSTCSRRINTHQSDLLTNKTHLRNSCHVFVVSGHFVSGVTMVVSQFEFCAHALFSIACHVTSVSFEQRTASSNSVLVDLGISLYTSQVTLVNNRVALPTFWACCSSGRPFLSRYKETKVTKRKTASSLNESRGTPS